MEENSQYKSELYSKFKDIGLLDTLKAQMRFKLLEKLQVPQNKAALDTTDSPLLLKIINSLISDHLRLKNYNYSYSVFLPEIGTETLQSEEIMEILNINKSSVLNKGLLEQLIETFLQKRPKNMEKTNISTQTENYDNIVGLESRLNSVDDEFKKRIGNLEASIPKTMEEKFFNYKRDLEKRLKLEMNAELTRIREFEFSLVRIEEAEKYKSKMEEYREELERIHQERLNKLRAREKETIDKCTERLRFIESANHDHRQRILKDFEMLKMREEDLERTKMLFEESAKLERTKLEQLEKEYKGKIQELEDLKKASQTKVDHEIAYNKLNLVKEIEEDRLSIYQKTKQLDEELLKINQLKETVTRLNQQNMVLSKENAKLNEEITALRQRKKDLSSENEQAKEQNRLLLFTSQRDQENLKNYEFKIKTLKEENERLQNNMKERQGIYEEQIILKQELMKKKNDEISVYQEKNEELKKKLEIFMRDTKENQGNFDMNFYDGGKSKEKFTEITQKTKTLKKNLENELMKISDFEEDQD